jgi:hypothetical protein
VPENKKYKGDLVVLGRRLFNSGVRLFKKDVVEFADGTGPPAELPPTTEESRIIAAWLAVCRTLDTNERPLIMEQSNEYPGHGMTTRQICLRLERGKITRYASLCMRHELKRRIDRCQDD